MALMEKCSHCPNCSLEEKEGQAKYSGLSAALRLVAGGSHQAVEPN